MQVQTVNIGTNYQRLSCEIVVPLFISLLFLYCIQSGAHPKYFFRRRGCWPGGVGGGEGADPEAVYNLFFILNLCYKNHVFSSSIT